MKMKKGICCLLLLTMLVQLLPGMQLFAIDTRAAADYVTDGLVSLFDGKNHGSADNIWEDLCGENDITDLMANSSTGVGFTEEGWHSVNSKHAMPAALLDVLKGKEYTFEMVLGGVTMNGTSYATLIANNGGTSNEKFALYVQKSDGIFYAKASGLTRTTTPPCPHVEDGLNIVANSTVTVTFKENGSVNLYINGKLLSTAAAGINGNTVGTTLAFGESASSKTSDTLYKGFRFYSKALSAGEVASNYAVDKGEKPTYKELNGDYITDGLVSLYNGIGHTAKDTTWKDEYGSNDMTGLVPDENAGIGFTDEGWRSVGSKHTMPAALLDTLAGEEFSFEVRLGDVAALDPATNKFIPFIANNSGLTSEKFAVYIATGGGKTDNLMVKTSGLASANRPTVTGGSTALVQNSTLTVTYKSGGNVNLYVNGVLKATSAAPQTNGNTGMTNLTFGETASTKLANILYKGFRFYSTELTALEVAHNYEADLTIIPEGGGKTTDYVSDGLVSLYTGKGHVKEDTVWKDEWGKNDITVESSDTNYFTEEGYQLSQKQFAMPGELLSVLRGNEYTLEVALGEITSRATGSGNLYIPLLCNIGGTEYFSLYLQTQATGATPVDKLILKTSGLAAADRPAVETALELCKNSTVSVTFKAGGKVCVYIGGELKAEVDAPAANGNNFSSTAALIFGNTSDTKRFDALYKGFRFYDRALTAAEIGFNSFIDDPDKEIPLEYVKDGLVSLYSGKQNTLAGHAADSSTWYDLVGDNHITGLSTTGDNHFTDDAYHLKAAEYNFPSALLGIINGSAFTVEMTLGDFQTISGTTFATFLNSTGNDNFAVFWRSAGDLLEVKTSSSTSGRPTVTGGEELFRNSTITITFSAGNATKVYVDGWLVATGSAPDSIGALGTLKFGNATNTKIHAADYKGFRFYNRVLTDEEIIINATADGNYDPDKAQPKGYVKVAQPDTGIVGDIAFSEYVTDKATMTRLTTAEVKPANLIFYIDEVNGELKAVDAAGKNAFATVKEIFTALDLKIIPTFYVKSETVAKAVCNYLKDDLYEDVFIMSSDPAIVKAARETYPLIRGIIDYSTKYHGALTEEQLIEVRRTVNTNLSKVVVLPWSAVTAENIDWLNDRAMTVWIDAGKVTEKTDAVKALLSGTYGIVSSSTEFLYTTCKEYIPAGTMTRMPVNVAHRGLFTQADENTLEAMIAAYNAGAEMVEIDIYLTTDGKLAINHNSTTTAIYDKSLTVENCTMAQLKELRSKKFGNQMPSLDEVFEYFKDKEMRFMIEIKSAKTGIVKVMKELIEQYDFYDRCTVITFSRTGMFDELMKVYPEMPVGYLTDAGNPSRNDPELAVKFAQNTVQPYNNTFAPNHSGYDGEYVKAALKRGITTWTWTISTQGLIYEYMLYGHTGITGNRTDYIGVLPKTLRSEMKNGETLLTGEAVKIPLQAESYAGKALVTSSARLAVQVLEGSAAVEGTTVTPTAPGKIVLLATYTHHMGNYTYTLTKTLELNAREPARVDVNGDKLINIQDVTTLLQYLAGEECEYVEEGLDVNGDKKVSVKDVSRLLAYLADSSVTIYP